MKKREGFVSNSSTSSFVCYGVGDISIKRWDKLAIELKKRDPKWYASQIDRLKKYGNKEVLIDGLENPETLEEKLKFQRVRTCNHDIDTSNKFCPECGQVVWIEKQAVSQDDLEGHLRDWLYEEPAGIRYCCSDGWEALGFDYQDIPDDMTMGEWRKQAHEFLSAVLEKKVECHYIEEEIAS